MGSVFLKILVLTCNVLVITVSDHILEGRRGIDILINNRQIDMLGSCVKQYDGLYGLLI